MLGVLLGKTLSLTLLETDARYVQSQAACPALSSTWPHVHRVHLSSEDVGFAGKLAGTLSPQPCMPQTTFHILHGVRVDGGHTAQAGQQPSAQAEADFRRIVHQSMACWFEGAYKGNALASCLALFVKRDGVCTVSCCRNGVAAATTQVAVQLCKIETCST